MAEDIKFSESQIKELVRIGKETAKAPVQPTLDQIESSIKQEQMQDVQNITVSIPRHIVESIKRTADFRNISVEKLASDLLVESLNAAVGRAWVTGPSSLSGLKTCQKKITGPSRSFTQGKK